MQIVEAISAHGGIAVIVQWPAAGGAESADQ
jgi:hypothetical protein